jgi:hypothetical protein
MVANSDPAADNLFQLNVLIWGLFALPPGAPVTPILRDLGYRLRYVEYPLQAGVGELADVQAAMPRIGPNPVADLVLERSTDDRYVLTECKASSYGADSSTAEQGRGLLVAGARVRARLGVASGKAEASFVLPAPQANEMDATIGAMQQQVTDAGQPVCEGGSINIEVRDDGVYLGRDDQPAQQAALPTELRPMKRVLDVAVGDDPQPLYVVPWIPHATKSSDLSAFREKVRAEVLSRVGRATPPANLTIGFDDVLHAVSHGIYRHWRDKDSLHGQVFQVLGTWLRSLIGGDATSAIRNNRLEVTIQSDEERGRLMETIRTSSVPERPEGFQAQLFGEDRPEPA